MKLFEREVNQVYMSEDGTTTMARERGLTPYGNDLDGRWVLRRNGEWVGFDQYRNDLAELHDLKLVHGVK